ncbi:hypothetical protein [Piscinibacter sakaiensis]|uniref:Uncharacterized protein n=1 Tax=Piscinibacter sakaiensis TaxID=1547922 RepID=A0A0K8NX86_PISS1|nr:hypothetical protein [Piscinibacter sakaiensis]GAP35012.1 hypothetical protein ISF6_0577 [Piscinibacter sakaiensis]
MRLAAARLPSFLVLWALVAQLWLPVVHAAAMNRGDAVAGAWCGDPARAQAVLAALPPEIRDALGGDSLGTGRMVDCAPLCALGATLPPPAAAASTVVLRDAGLEPPPRERPVPRARAQAPTPPSQGPPARA